jgi:hypothetical protein
MCCFGWKFVPKFEAENLFRKVYKRPGDSNKNRHLLLPPLLLLLAMAEVPFDSADALRQLRVSAGELLDSLPAKGFQERSGSELSAAWDDDSAFFPREIWILRFYPKTL